MTAGHRSGQPGDPSEAAGRDIRPAAYGPGLRQSCDKVAGPPGPTVSDPLGWGRWGARKGPKRDGDPKGEAFKALAAVKGLRGRAKSRC